MQRMEYSRSVAQFLLACEAVKLSPNNPFTWASGWKSPIYCDNRKTLAFPQIRSFIKQALANVVQTNFDNAEVIAGVATGAIAQGALVADMLNKPFCYVRSAPKDHGLSNQIEGNLRVGQKVIVIEDLISTGGSSLHAVDALRNSGADVLGMVAIFTYGFSSAIEAFRKANVKLITLTNYYDLIDLALHMGYINASDVNLLQMWRENPAEWGK